MITVRFRVDVSPACAIGPGKIALLMGVERTGSLRRAAQELGMSYRRAWLLIDGLNRSFTEAVTTASVGGKGGGGVKLTPLGEELVRRYNSLAKRSIRSRSGNSRASPPGRHGRFRRLPSCRARRSCGEGLAQGLRGSDEPRVEVVVVEPVISTSAQSPARSLPAFTIRTTPSISGASPSLRAMAWCLRRIHQHRSALTDTRGEALRADRARALHEARIALVLDLRRNVIGERVGGRALDRGVLEAADAVELRRVEPVQQLLELRLGFAGKADDERTAQDELRALAPPGRDAIQRVHRVRRPAHALQHRRAAVLERDVEVRQHPPLRHQRDHGIDVRVRVNIMQSHPRAERAESPRQIEEAGLVGLVPPGRRRGSGCRLRTRSCPAR